MPQTYLPETGDRLVLYKRLAQARTPSEVDRLQAETEDRFGHLPTSAKNLFAMGRLRLAAEEAGVKSIDLAEDRLQIRFYDRPSIEPIRLVSTVEQIGGALLPSGMVLVPAPPRGTDRIEAIDGLMRQMLDLTA